MSEQSANPRSTVTIIGESSALPESETSLGRSAADATFTKLRALYVLRKMAEKHSGYDVVDQPVIPSGNVWLVDPELSDSSLPDNSREGVASISMRPDSHHSLVFTPRDVTLQS